MNNKICKGKLCILQNENGVNKKIEEFSISRKRKDGHESICKKCRSYTRSKEYKELRKLELEQEENGKKNNEGKRKCKKCNIYLKLEDFSKDKNIKDGLASICRKCKSGKKVTKIRKVSRAKHIIKDNVEGKICYKCKNWKSFKDDNFKSTGKYKDGANSYESSCRECLNIKERKRYHKTKVLMTEEELKESKEKKSKEQRSKIRIIDGERFKFCNYHKEWTFLDKFKKDGTKKYVTGEPKYKESCNVCKNEQKRLRTKIDIEFKITNNLRNRTWQSLKTNSKSETTKEILGNSIENVKSHLENQFDEGMTWENYGSYWHIDHIIPCAAFNLKNKQEQKRCFNYLNLQPLEASENILKSNKYEFNPILEIKLYFSIKH